MVFLCQDYLTIWAQKTDHLALRKEEEEAKRRRSASTTPRSATGTLPHDYDGVMGVASVGSQESVRFGEEDHSEFKEVEEMATHSQNVLDEACNDEDHRRNY